MANPVNQHCASCFGTLSYPIKFLITHQARTLIQAVAKVALFCTDILTNFWDSFTLKGYSEHFPADHPQTDS